MIFAIHGLPLTLVSDNGPPFQSAVFYNFMRANDTFTVVYHSITHRPMDWVKTIKQALSNSKITKDSTIEIHIGCFLASYRNTHHSTTLRTLAKLLLNRSPRTHLSLVHPCMPQQVEQTVEKPVGDHQPRCFTIDSDVLIRDLHINATEKWCKGIITKVLGSLNYEVNIDSHTHQAHIDHILPCPRTLNDTDNVSLSDITSHQDKDVITSQQEKDVITMPLVSSETCETSTNVGELVTLRPCRNCQPPKRLIEEMS